MKADHDILKTSVDHRIDDLDRKILALLMQDATTPYTDIAEQLTVSNGTIHVRMKKLKELGIVRGAHLEVDVRMLGFDIIAYIQISLEKDADNAKVVEAMRDIPEIVDADFVTGNYCIIVKIICRNSTHLREVLKDKIQKIEGVHRTDTCLLLDEGIHRPALVDEW